MEDTLTGVFEASLLGEMVDALDLKFSSWKSIGSNPIVGRFREKWLKPIISMINNYKDRQLQEKIEIYVLKWGERDVA
jgi:hypothetical protein